MAHFSRPKRSVNGNPGGHSYRPRGRGIRCFMSWDGMVIFSLGWFMSWDGMVVVNSGLWPGLVGENGDI